MRMSLRRGGVWPDVIVVGAVVVVGVVFAGLTHQPMGQSEMGYGSEPVEYPVDIPGCASVEPPEEDQFYEVIVGRDYDDPSYPWLTSKKANSMSIAVRKALPSQVDVVAGSTFWSGGDPLIFQPVASADGAYDPGTSADGIVSRDGVEGSLMVNVTRVDDGPKPCQAGWLDAREILSDGTVVDTRDTWDEFDGDRTHSNIVRVYAPDNSVVVASSSDRNANYVSTGSVPLSIEELRTIALRPELLWSAPVPEGTLPLPISCDTNSKGAGQFSPEAVDRLNASLDEFWRAAEMPVELDRPLGSMRTAPSGSAGACGAVLADDGTLMIRVIDADYVPAENPWGAVTLPDGSEFRDDNPGASAMTLDGDPIEDVTLVKPSGTRVDVQIAASETDVDRPLLQAIALVVAGSVD
ncbi:MAG: hypothetical protein NTX68_23075 [Rhodococcus sp.]|nr:MULTISPECIES: hypothetical protein [Rhodococcus]MSX07761.1 hypothetical protein [Actinomycetota bacterium]MBW4782453.1 hypothetical protein [Rhodococcus fascians]MCX6493834.1 hypothetical protein [Rhodococcus sp. (in: high G+C Gram-positive bacteria)]MDJ0005854.1 hypothetical protein [Rhodococcus fascians]MDJ0425692.1 hypothetical protein [Rhodococcus fascians]